MLNIVQRSQISGLMAIDGFGVSNLGEMEEVWVDETGKVAYISASAGYIPLEQVADISDIGLATYGELAVDLPENLQPLYQLAVGSAEGEPLGWIEDFLFDWRTGEIAAYILAGEIAQSLGESALLSPEDVENITLDRVIVRAGTQERLKTKSEGLKGFFSEKSQQVEHLVQGMGDRVHQLLSPQDEPTVRVKVKQVDGDRHLISDRWDALRHNISRSLSQVKSGWDSTWQHLTGKS